MTDIPQHLVATYNAIKAAGAEGLTDFELQQVSDVNGVSYLRGELWRMRLIRILQDAEGRTIFRQARTYQWCAAWVVT